MLRLLSLLSLLVLLPLAAPASATNFQFALEPVDSAYPGNGRPGISAAADVDGDGEIDVIAAGGNVLVWYEAPTWTRHFIEPTSPPNVGANGLAVFDIDGDGDPDAITTYFKGDLMWWENPGGAAATGTWTPRVVDGIPNDFMHDLVVGDIDANGDMEVVVLYTEGGGVYVYDVPADPKTQAWPRATIRGSISDPFLGLALGDLDQDGDLDVAVSNTWHEHPADPWNDPWPQRPLFAAAVQNLAIADLNGDGRLDVIGAEGFVNPNGRIVWAASPPSPKVDPWTETTIDTGLDGPENLWAGDLDGDGDIDLASGEMGTSNGFGDGDSNFLVYESLAADGSSFVQRVMADNVGISARIQPIDIDGDGDLDFVADGNAEDHIYLWRNNTPAPLPVPVLPFQAFHALLAALGLTAIVGCAFGRRRMTRLR